MYRCSWGMRFVVLGLLGAVAGCSTKDEGGTRFVTENGKTRRLSKSEENLHDIGLAVNNYMSQNPTNSRFPPAAIRDSAGKPLLSWRVWLLPHLDGQKDLYAKFHLDEPWDSPHNKELLSQMPKCYQSPARSAADGMTQIMVFTGKHSLFEKPEGAKSSDIVDGRMDTILAVEAGPDKAVPWTKPEDLILDDDPLAALGNIPAEGFQAVFCDCAVHQIKTRDKAGIRALITPNGGDRVPPDFWK
jgi:hypothetical protein